MADPTVDSRAALLANQLFTSGTGSTATGTVGGTGTTDVSKQLRDQFERSTKPGFHGPETRATQGAGDGGGDDDEQETGVQPGNGNVSEMMAKEFGPQAMMLLSLLQGTGAGFLGSTGGSGAGGGGSETLGSIGGGGSGIGYGISGAVTGGGYGDGSGSGGGQGGLGVLGQILGAGGGGSGIESLIEALLDDGGGQQNVGSSSNTYGSSTGTYSGSVGTYGYGGSSAAGGSVSGNSETQDPTFEPALMLTSSGTQQTGQYQSLSNATLWGNGTIQTTSGNSQEPLQNEVSQGASGDCYFLSTLASQAASDPQSVQNMVRPDPNGVQGDYQVRFYAKNQSTGQMEPEWVSVDDKLPVGSDGKTLYDHVPVDSSGQPCIGMALIEKAYAKFNDAHQTLQSEGATGGAGYDGIGEGGTGAEALEAITGQPATILGSSGSNEGGAGGTVGGVSVAGSSSSGGGSGGQQGSLGQTTTQQAVLQALQLANNHQPVTAGTVGTGGTPDANGVDRLPDGLMTGHQYSVLGTYTDKTSGQAMVTLRNPWGGDTGNNPGANSDGVFSIPLSQFMQDFGTVVSQQSGQGGGSSNTGSGSGTGQFTGNDLQTFSLRNLQQRI